MQETEGRPVVEISHIGASPEGDNCRLIVDGRELPSVVNFNLSAHPSEKPATLRLGYADTVAPKEVPSGYCTLKLEIPVWVEAVLVEPVVSVKVDSPVQTSKDVYKAFYRMAKRHAENHPEHRALFEMLPDPLPPTKATV